MVTVTPQPTFRAPVLHIPAHAADALSASVAMQRGLLVIMMRKPHGYYWLNLKGYSYTCIFAVGSQF
jgi:hypothetical protein